MVSLSPSNTPATPCVCPAFLLVEILDGGLSIFHNLYLRKFYHLALQYNVSGEKYYCNSFDQVLRVHTNSDLNYFLNDLLT